MKHIFIINPAAGKGGKFERMIAEIRRVCEGIIDSGNGGIDNFEYEIYVTTEPSDATRYVKEMCKQQKMCKMRFYACGGDGTLSEVAAGAVGHDNAEIGLIPAGTGNDFVRNFTNKSNFHDIEKQILGSGIAVDLIKYRDNYGINMINIGFDGDVAAKVAKIKRSPLIPEGLAYIAGIGIVFFRKLGTKMKITLDESDSFEGDFLLLAAGNGRYCGGGFMSAPKALLNDGQMDICIVDLVSRGKFINLIEMYKNGTFLESEKALKIIKYIKCKKLDITLENSREISVDGEIKTEKELSFSVVQNAVVFSVPVGSECIALESTHAQKFAIPLSHS